nr:unnamed protein product [Spirometra erinaceieuropaei]
MEYLLQDVIAALAAQQMAHLVFTKNQTKFLARFINGTVVFEITRVELSEELIKLIDSNIQFTMKGETDSQLPFFNALVHLCAAGNCKQQYLANSLHKANITLQQRSPCLTNTAVSEVYFKELERIVVRQLAKGLNDYTSETSSKPTDTQTLLPRNQASGEQRTTQDAAAQSLEA